MRLAGGAEGGVMLERIRDWWTFYMVMWLLLDAHRDSTMLGGFGNIMPVATCFLIAAMREYFSSPKRA